MGSGRTNDAASAAAKVTDEPMNAYHVHAVAAVHHTHASTAILGLQGHRERGRVVLEAVGAPVGFLRDGEAFVFRRLGDSRPRAGEHGGQQGDGDEGLALHADSAWLGVAGRGSVAARSGPKGLKNSNSPGIRYRSAEPRCRS